MSRTLILAAVLLGAVNRIAALLLVFCAISLLSPQPAGAVTIAWSPVGNPGNANDTTVMTDGTSGYGSVAYNYNIGTKDVTASQYVEFLNAKDPTGANTLGLYDSRMSNSFGGINFNNLNPAGSMYSVISGRGNHPANSVSWYDAIRFANWMNNGQGNSSTETGAYTLGTLDAGGIPVTPPLTHNAGSQIWLPTENEWYKAAYYDPRTPAQGGPPLDSHYWIYGTSSNQVPSLSAPTALPNHVNASSVVGTLTDVGAYSGTTSPYGAFDMAGNVFQWNEALLRPSDSYRTLRGGSFGTSASDMVSAARTTVGPTGVDIAGFRLASVQETSSGWNNPSGGQFHIGANWVFGTTPTPLQPAVFDLSATYTVTFASSQANDRLVVRQGNVTFDLGGFAYNLASTGQDSVGVAKETGNVASLTLTNGTLAAINSTIGSTSGANGQVAVGAGATWTNSGNVQVGGGTGLLTVNPGGVFNVGGTLSAVMGGTVTLAGGTLHAPTFNVSGGTFNRNSGTLELAGGLLSVTGGANSPAHSTWRMVTRSA